MSDTDPKAAAVDGIAKAVALGATIVGQPVAASTAEAIGALVVDSLTRGTLNRLVAHAQATAEVINTEDAAEKAAREPT